MRAPFTAPPAGSYRKHAIACLLILSVCLPAAATTLVKCKIGKKTVWSDTDCPDDAQRRKNGFSSFPASKTIRIKYPSKKSGSSTSAKK